MTGAVEVSIEVAQAILWAEKLGFWIPDADWKLPGPKDYVIYLRAWKSPFKILKSLELAIC